MAEAEAEADIDSYTQDVPYFMALSPETAAAFAESMADNTEMPTSPDQPEVLNLTPATSKAENDTVPDAAEHNTPIQPETRTSARQMFTRAFTHAQLSSHPDDEPFYFTEAQRDELPMDHQTLLTILNWYGLEDEVGLFIFENHPQLAANINPALAAGLEPHIVRMASQKSKEEFIKNYVIDLAQTALDELEKSKSQPATPRA